MESPKKIQLPAASWCPFPASVSVRSALTRTTSNKERYKRLAQQDSIPLHLHGPSENTFPRLPPLHNERTELLVVARFALVVDLALAPLRPACPPHLVELLHRDIGLHDDVRVARVQELVVAEARHLINVDNGCSVSENEGVQIAGRLRGNGDITEKRHIVKKAKLQSTACDTVRCAPEKSRGRSSNLRSASATPKPAIHGISHVVYTYIRVAWRLVFVKGTHAAVALAVFTFAAKPETSVHMQHT